MRGTLTSIGKAISKGWADTVDAVRRGAVSNPWGAIGVFQSSVSTALSTVSVPATVTDIAVGATVGTVIGGPVGTVVGAFTGWGFGIFAEKIGTTPNPEIPAEISDFGQTPLLDTMRPGGDDDSNDDTPSEEDASRNREESFDRDGASNDDDEDSASPHGNRDRYPNRATPGAGYIPSPGTTPDSSDGPDDDNSDPNAKNGPPNAFGEYGRPDPYARLGGNRGGDSGTSPDTDHQHDPSDHDSFYGGGGDPSVDSRENDPGGGLDSDSDTGRDSDSSRGVVGNGLGGGLGNGNAGSAANSRSGTRGGDSDSSRGVVGNGLGGGLGSRNAGSASNSRSGNRGGNRGGNSGNSGNSGNFKPIVLDLDGDGVELVALDDSSAFYDINADGYLYNLGWAGADDGILAYDKNSDGVIDRKDEISFIDYVPGARTDLEGLRHFDGNNDGVLDASDAEFSKFRVWQDLDQDGVSDAGELRTLAAAGVRSIELGYAPGDDGRVEVRAGNTIAGQGRYRRVNGATGMFADVAFAASAFGFRSDGDNLEFKSADGQGQVYVAPSGAGAVRMDFAASVNAAHIGAIGGVQADVLDGDGVSRDLLLFGDAGADRLTGGSGDDWLAGGAGADTLRGGDGHDVLFFDASDDVHGGGGQDVGIVSGSDAVDLFMDQAGLEALHSGSGDDRLMGFASAQGVIIDGGGGRDTIRGSHHGDVLSGGDGSDYIKGHKGEDVVLGGAGDDTLAGNMGDDILFGGSGDDHLYGLVDDDRLFGGEGADFLYGGSGADILRGGADNDRLSGDEGDDHLKGQQGEDVLTGGAGDDWLEGNMGDDRLYGGAGEDYLNGLLGDDRLEGGAGDDTYAFDFPNILEGAMPDFGDDIIRDSGGAHDVLAFGRRRHEELWLSRHGDDLRVEVLGAGDSVVVEDQYADTAHRIEHLHATTAVSWFGISSGQSVSIGALVNAMAQFDKPQSGWSGMSARERADVHAAWRTVGIAPTVIG